MTVRELIEKLQLCPSDTVVKIAQSEIMRPEITGLEVEEGNTEVWLEAL